MNSLPNFCEARHGIEIRIYGSMMEERGTKVDQCVTLYSVEEWKIKADLIDIELPGHPKEFKRMVLDFCGSCPRATGVRGVGGQWPQDGYMPVYI